MIRNAAYYRALYARDPRQRERRVKYQQEYNKRPEQRARRAKWKRDRARRARFAIFARDGFRCAYCHQERPVHRFVLDHRRPRCLGGTDDPGNLVTSCRRCNRKKGTMTYDEYMLKLNPDYAPSWITDEEPEPEAALEPY